MRQTRASEHAVQPGVRHAGDADRGRIGEDAAGHVAERGDARGGDPGNGGENEENGKKEDFARVVHGVIFIWGEEVADRPFRS